MPHKRIFDRSDRPTQVHKLLTVLGDHRWHATKELVRRVSHAFAVSKFKLLQYGYIVEKERHPAKRYQWRYRLLENPRDNG